LSKYNYLTDQLDKALQFAQKGSDLFAGIQSQEVLADLKVNEGLIWLARGDSGKARVCSQDAIRLADEVNGENKLTDDRARAYRLSAQVAMIENDLDLADSHLVLSDEIFQHTGDAIEQARNLVIRSELLARLKKPADAHALRQRAKSVFEQFGAKADLKSLSLK
jgi:tetratricopeptide (TPR) repeat protein